MLKPKCCPKCRGDVVVERDIYGRYELCLYCGYLYEPGNITEMKRQKNEMKKIAKCSRRKIHTKLPRERIMSPE